MRLKHPLIICVIVPLAGLTVVGINTIAARFGEYHAIGGSAIFLSLLALIFLSYKKWQRQTENLLTRLDRDALDANNPLTDLIRARLEKMEQDHRNAYDQVVHDLEVQKRSHREQYAALQDSLQTQTDNYRAVQTHHQYDRMLVQLMRNQIRRVVTNDDDIRHHALTQIEFLNSEILRKPAEAELTFDTWQLLDDIASLLSDIADVHVSVQPLCPRSFGTPMDGLRGIIVQYCLNILEQKKGVARFELTASPGPQQLCIQFTPSPSPMFFPANLRDKQNEDLRLTESALTVTISALISRNSQPLHRRKALVVSNHVGNRQSLAHRLETLGAIVTFDFHDPDIHAVFVNEDGQDTFASLRGELPDSASVFVFGAASTLTDAAHVRLEHPIQHQQLIGQLKRLSFQQQPHPENAIQDTAKPNQEKSHELDVFDREAALKAANGSYEMANEMTQLLFESLGQEQKCIADHVGQGDMIQAAQAAHKLGGALSYCGFQKLKHATAELERSIKSDDPNLRHRKLMRFNSEAIDVLNWIATHPHPFAADPQDDSTG